MTDPVVANSSLQPCAPSSHTLGAARLCSSFTSAAMRSPMVRTGHHTIDNNSVGSIVELRQGGSSPTNNNGNSPENTTSEHKKTNEKIDEVASAFVSDFTYSSVRYSTDPVTGEKCRVCYEPVSLPVAVLFIDVSGYSKLAEKLAPRGAHALASVVNAYFAKILEVVHAQGGDVLKIAGDSIMAGWTTSLKINQGKEDQPQQLQDCCRAACFAALQVQKKCGIYKYEDLALRLRIGIDCGNLDGEILFTGSAEVASGMAEAYHFIGGEALQNIGTFVDGAPSGEVCISKKVLSLANSAGSAGAGCGEENAFKATAVKDADGAFIIMDAVLDAANNYSACDNGAAKRNHTMRTTSERQLKQQMEERRTHSRSGGGGETEGPLGDDNGDEQLDEAKEDGRCSDIDKKFIFPAIIARVNQVVASTPVEGYRNLYVLFVKKVVTGIPVSVWFAEVSGILAHYRCPITQVIDDDNGVHIEAAINLFVNERDAADLAVSLGTELAERDTGCAIGMAAGLTMAGIQGDRRSCRYSITGGPVVRACRLMQYAASFWDDEGNPKPRAQGGEEEDWRAIVQGKAPPAQGEKGEVPSVIIDDSIVSALRVSTMVRKLRKITIKGAADPVQVSTLSFLTSRSAGGLAGATSANFAHQNSATEIALDSTKKSNLGVITGPLSVGNLQGSSPECWGLTTETPEPLNFRVPPLPSSSDIERRSPQREKVKQEEIPRYKPKMSKKIRVTTEPMLVAGAKVTAAQVSPRRVSPARVSPARSISRGRKNK